MEPVEVMNDMNAVVTQLGVDVGAATLWETFGTAIPYIAIILGVALGYTLVKRLLKGASKLKFRI